MALQVNLPDSLLRQATELAGRQRVTVDQVVAAALSAQVSAAATRPSIAERARQVNWQKVDEILASVNNRFNVGEQTSQQVLLANRAAACAMVRGARKTRRPMATEEKVLCFERKLLVEFEDRAVLRKIPRHQAQRCLCSDACRSTARVCGRI
jgi:hypothetical protein